MRLVNKKSNHPLVEFSKGQTIFYNRFLEQEMRSMGIPIPHGLRGVYHGKDAIFLGEPDFPKAFREVYFFVAMDPETFHWEE